METRISIYRHHCIQGENLERVNTFKYLGATLAENGDLNAEMTHRIQSGWKNWKRVSWILSNRSMSFRVEGKLYKTVVRPAMMYHRRSQDFCLGGGATRPTPPSLASVVHTFEAVAGSRGSVSAPAVSRVMGGAPERNKNSKKI